MTKLFEITQKIIQIQIFFVFINFSKNVREYVRTANPSFKIAGNHLKIT